MNSNIELNTKYNQVQKEISFQLKEIQSKLKKHSKEQKQSNSYGYLGDLGYIKELLGQANSFIKN